MKVLIPYNTKFNYSQCKELFEKYKNLIDDHTDFFHIIFSTQFFSFLTDDNNFVGCLYFYKTPDNKLMFNGFANRKMHSYNLEAIKLATSWFNTDIYAKTSHKTAAFCLLRAGFVKFDNQLYVKKKGDSYGR